MWSFDGASELLICNRSQDTLGIATLSHILENTSPSGPPRHLGDIPVEVVPFNW